MISFLRRPVRRRVAVTLLLLSTLLSTIMVIVNGPAPAGAAGAETVDVEQCLNAGPPVGDCTWSGGNVQDSNSDYFEGMSIPQRVLLTGIDSSDDTTHVLEFSHQATKNGTHAYDWLTSYDQAVAEGADFGIPMVLNECDPHFAAPAGQTACEAIFPGGTSINVDVPDDAFVSASPAGPATTATQDLIDDYEGVYGNRQITLWGDAPFTNASLTLSHDVASGADTGDSRMNYVLTWTSASTKVLVQYGAHLAVGLGSVAAWGADLGAGDVAGASSDNRVARFDGESLGGMTNPVNSNAIASGVGEINITKIATADGSDFRFTFDAPGPGSDPFTLHNRQTATFEDLSPGVYTVTEAPNPPAFILLSIICDGANVVTDQATGVTTITLLPGETVNCTYTNGAGDTPPPSLINITKVVSGEGDGDFDFNFDPPGVAPDQPLAVLNDGETDYIGQLIAGDWVVTELAEDGFELVDITCSGTTYQPNLAAGTVTITLTEAQLDSGVIVNCTYTNRAVPPPAPAEIHIFKTVEGAGDGDFDFVYNPPGADPDVPFVLGNNETRVFTGLAAGSYTVGELAEAGWDLTGINCNPEATDFPNLAAGNVLIQLGTGERVDCTFTNTAEPVYGNDPDPDPGYGEDPYGYGNPGGSNDPDPFGNDPVVEPAGSTNKADPEVGGQVVNQGGNPADPGAGTAGAGPVATGVDPGAELPRTGAHNPMAQVLFALVLMGAGSAALLLGRKRRTEG